MGETQHGRGQWNSDIISGSITPEALEAMLAAFNPEPPIPEQEYGMPRKTPHQQKQNVKTSTLSLTDDEIKSVERKALPIGSAKVIGNAIYLLSDSYRWLLAANNQAAAERINQIIPISKGIQSIRKQMREGITVTPIQETVKSALKSYKDSYGEYPKDDSLVIRFLRNRPSVFGIYDAMVSPCADILNIANLYNENGSPINGHNRAVEALLFLQQRMLSATPSILSQCFPNEADELIDEMHRNADIFLSEDCAWQLREDFISGNAWGKIDALNASTANETDASKRSKWQYGIAELEKAAGWIPIEDADFSPHSSWIPENIINAWVGDLDGLARPHCLRLGKLSKNESGKWGIRYEGNHSVFDRSIKKYRKASGGQWEAYADEIVYYLNMQKQRSSYNDTETFNREHDENFKLPSSLPGRA